MTDTGEGSIEPVAPVYFASFTIPFEIFILLLILPVFFLDLCSKKRNRSRDARLTKALMLAVFFSNLIHQMTWILLFTTCSHCVATAIGVVQTRNILRGINLLFLIHRAKLVQGMTPILSRKWFTKILPTFVVCWHLGWVIWGVKNGIETEQSCESYADSDTFHWCWDLDAGARSEHHFLIYIHLALDLLMTVCLMALFIVPMYQVYNADLGTMNANQIRQRMKLKRLLVWSVLLTFINQITSTLFWLLAFDRSPMIMLLAFIGLFDPPINVWSSWLMVTRNREYLYGVCCCCCYKADERRRIIQHSTAFTDMSSRNSRGPVPFSRQSTISKNSRGPVPFSRQSTIELSESALRN